MTSEGRELVVNEELRVAREELLAADLVRPGHFEPSAARVLARLQKFREQADYGEAFIVDLQGAEEELAAARAFVDAATEFSAHPPLA